MLIFCDRYNDLQIFAVKPYSEEIEEALKEKVPNSIPLPPAIAKYRQSNNVRVFLYSKPFRKTKVGTLLSSNVASAHSYI